MSFDLNFGREDGSFPQLDELTAYFRNRKSFEVSDSQDSGGQFWYHNVATGVYCSFTLDVVEDVDDDLTLLGRTGLSFNLNYVRPSFFAYETMPLVQAFCEHFDLLVEDIQEETVERAEAPRLIESWRRHNAWAVKAMAQQAEVEMSYLPEEQASAWWQYAGNKQMIQDAVGDDIFVPTIMIFESPAKQLFTMIVWPEAIPQFFPRCDQILVQRKKTSFFRQKEESGVVSYDRVIAQIGPYLDDYVTNDGDLKYLPPDKAALVTPLFRNLELASIDLSAHTSIGADGFHDVVLEGNPRQG